MDDSGKGSLGEVERRMGAENAENAENCVLSRLIREPLTRQGLLAQTGRHRRTLSR